MQITELLMMLARFIAVALTITVHEFTKALFSKIQGDPLPEKNKRLTLNPFRHIEPIGFLLMYGIRFGWGKPVETSPVYYKDRKKGILITYTMPILANIILGIVCTILFYSLDAATILYGSNLLLIFVRYILQQTVFTSYCHALFNLIPVYPMCGSRILGCFLQPNTVIKMANNQQIFLMGLVILTMLGVTGQIIEPIAYFFMSII